MKKILEPEIGKILRIHRASESLAIHISVKTETNAEKMQVLKPVDIVVAFQTSRSRKERGNGGWGEWG